MSVQLANWESHLYVWGQSVIRFSNITKDSYVTKDGNGLSPTSSFFCWERILKVGLEHCHNCCVFGNKLLFWALIILKQDQQT
jgi:hypothetical protein